MSDEKVYGTTELQTLRYSLLQAEHEVKRLHAKVEKQRELLGLCLECTLYTELRRDIEEALQP